MLPIFVCYGVLQRFFSLALYVPFLLTFISLPPLLLIFLFWTFCFSIGFYGSLWSNLANAWLSHLLVCLLTSLLLLIFVALRTISRFCEFHLNLFVFLSINMLNEDVCYVDVLLKLGDVKVAFGILSQCFTQKPSYLLHSSPPYWSFDTNLLLLT
jgi:hypothetical protein